MKAGAKELGSFAPALGLLHISVLAFNSGIAYQVQT